jgi:hypothetical protein
MEQSSLFADANPTRAEMRLSCSWNNGPFDDAGLHIQIKVGDREVCTYWLRASSQEYDFAEMFHMACREVQRMVIAHRITNSHIRRGRVVYGAPGRAGIPFDPGVITSDDDKPADYWYPVNADAAPELS